MKLKNNEQRKEWLRNYHDWGLWYEDDHIGAKYYHYIFDNGAELIVDEYHAPKDGPVPEMDHAYYHLVGGPKTTNGKWIYHPIYDRWADSETYLVEFLKFVGKDADL